MHSKEDNTPSTHEERQLAKIIAYNCEITREDFGVRSVVYEYMRLHLTDVIHCGWAVNYSMQLSSFEHLISGSSNLISHCLQSSHLLPASFHFMSSISAAPGGRVQESLNTNPNSLIGASGYARSKYVVECLCANAVGSYRDIVARVIRLGHLVGDRAHGQWTKKDEHPLIVRSLEKIKILPTRPLETKLSWLPVDDAATVCIEIMLATDDDLKNDAVFNVTHPKLISWNDVFLAGIRNAGLDFTESPQVTG